MQNDVFCLHLVDETDARIMAQYLATLSLLWMQEIVDGKSSHHRSYFCNSLVCQVNLIFVGSAAAAYSVQCQHIIPLLFSFLPAMMSLLYPVSSCWCYRHIGRIYVRGGRGLSVLDFYNEEEGINTVTSFAR